MMQSLLECFVGEMEGRPSNPFNTKYSKGLVDRGMLEARPHLNNGSKLRDALFVTEAGKQAIEPLYKTFFKITGAKDENFTDADISIEATLPSSLAGVLTRHFNII